MTKTQINMDTKIGINGFGRIGRLILRAVLQENYSSTKILAINSPADPQTNAHMFKYDSTYGVFPGSVTWDEDSIYVDGTQIRCLSFEQPHDIHWSDIGVEIVMECTGKFTSHSDASGHLIGGAKKVIISAPGKKEDVTIVMGVNQNKYDPLRHHIISNASCTTNCAAPLMKILHESFGIEHGLMTTIHSYTNDQQVLDKRHKDPRRARAAGTNIIPTTTGAAKAVGIVIPELSGRIDGMAFRVPTPTVSVTDFVATLNSSVSVNSINDAYIAASQGDLKGILQLSMEPLVSSDFRGSTISCVIDGLSTLAISENMVKVIGWYDNEWGYSCRTIELANFITSKGL
jgi:glyceraldehyde 3-phosphate dehydrogenase